MRYPPKKGANKKRRGAVLEVVLPGKRANDLSWEGRVYLGEGFVKVFPALEEYLPLTASSLLRHTKNAYFSRISFSFDHSSVP